MAAERRLMQAVVTNRVETGGGGCRGEVARWMYRLGGAAIIAGVALEFAACATGVTATEENNVWAGAVVGAVLLVAGGLAVQLGWRLGQKTIAVEVIGERS